MRATGSGLPIRPAPTTGHPHAITGRRNALPRAEAVATSSARMVLVHLWESPAERPCPMKTDESVDLVSDPMLAREVLDIHNKLMRNPVFRIRFWLALWWPRIREWWGWG